MIASQQPSKPAEAKWFWKEEEEEDKMSYERFKSLLASDQVKQVEFGMYGTSLRFIDMKGFTYTLNELPDEQGLLRQMYERNVIVTLEEMRFEKKMNAVSWFRDLAGVGDDITEEEMYEYRGYKTKRRNLPERAYVPSGLISSYDPSRKR